MNGIAAAALVTAAGIAGALLRHALVVAFGKRERFPVVILIVNGAGSLIAGALIGAAASLPSDWLLIGATGFCAAFTTFSTFAVDSVRLALEGRRRAAVGNVAASLVLGLGCAVVGASVTWSLLG